MKGLNPSQESGRRNGVVGLGLRPDHASTNINIKVSHVNNEFEVSVPSNSRFGDLKSVIAQKIGLNPETLKLLFRGKEKEDDEDLQTAGVKEDSKVLIMEDKTCKQEKPEEVKETCVISRGGEAVAKVREEVDKLSKQVSALQAVVDGGTKVDEKEIIYLSEMLMRQLLKLDGIDAEGEGRVQRKMEVRRVQSLVDTVDLLKSRNSNPSSNVDDIKSEATQWESFEPACGNVEDSSPQPPSAPSPQPSSAPSTQPPSAPSPQPPSSHSPQPPSAHSPMPSSNLSPIPSYAPAVPSYSPYTYTPPVYGHSPHDSNPYAHSPHDHNPYGHSSHDHIPCTHSPYNPYPYAPNPYASHHPNPHAPNPYAPSSHHPNPHAPNPYAPSSHHPNPQAPNPYAPSSHNPNPYAPSSHDPNLYAPSSHDPNLHAPNPYAPSSHDPNHRGPNPYAPNPYASNPYATSSHTPSPLPFYPPTTIPSNDLSPMQSYDPSSGKVNKDWEHFE